MHQETCFDLMGIRPEQPAKPNPDDEAMVMLDTGFVTQKDAVEVKYVRDMVPADFKRVNAYLPSVNQMKAIYGKGNHKDINQDNATKG